MGVRQRPQQVVFRLGVDLGGDGNADKIRSVLAPAGWLCRWPQLPEGCERRLCKSVTERLDELLLRIEVKVERPLRDLCGVRDPGDRDGFVAILLKQRRRRIQQLRSADVGRLDDPPPSS